MANQRRTTRRRRSRRSGHSGYADAGMARKLLIMVAVVAALFLGVAIFFRVRTVDVQGNGIYSREQILEVCGVEVGDNLLTVNRASVSGKIKVALPYVQDVSVGLLLPDTVVVQVQESDVAALVEAENGTRWYINVLGRVLGSSSQAFEGQVVRVTGFAISNPVPGEDAEAIEGQESNLAAALTILQEMEGSGLMDRVTEVDAGKDYDLLLLCGEQYEVQLGGTDEIPYKLQYLQAVLEQLEDYQTGVIDLTFDEERRAHFVPWVIE